MHPLVWVHKGKVAFVSIIKEEEREEEPVRYVTGGCQRNDGHEVG